MKKMMTALSAVVLTLVLAACGQKLNANKTTFKQYGLVSVIKGDASGAKAVHYRADTATGSSKINGGTFAITLPISDKKQTVHLTAGDKKQTVYVEAAKSLGTYKSSVAKYNQAVIGSALPKSVQKQMQSGQKQPTKAQIAAMTPQQQQAMAQAAATLKNELAKATAATKAQQLPTSATAGVSQVLKTKGQTVRANVTKDGNLIGYSLMVPVKAMKNKQEAEKFGITMALLGNSVGADAKTLMKKFAKAVKNQNKSQTTMKTIKSNGVKFDVGFSTTNLFIYITK
ncbi:hypothetical protein [Lacticaseibacillus zhaodongensis]|uniref:hypothetical protein n=1 Tax=Lacticaseibacillus zhaodongensis TaxID=2668065 RepID=UPI0012D35909|nr:hypothetical protein [Lacticaseibacillus zhaodongensis]